MDESFNNRHSSYAVTGWVVGSWCGLLSNMGGHARIAIGWWDQDIRFVLTGLGNISDSLKLLLPYSQSSNMQTASFSRGSSPTPTPPSSPLCPNQMDNIGVRKFTVPWNCSTISQQSTITGGRPSAPAYPTLYQVSRTSVKELSFYWSSIFRLVRRWVLEFFRLGRRTLTKNNGATIPWTSFITMTRFMRIGFVYRNRFGSWIWLVFRIQCWWGCWIWVRSTGSPLTLSPGLSKGCRIRLSWCRGSFLEFLIWKTR